MNTTPAGWMSHIIKPVTGPDDPELRETLNEGLSQIEAKDLVAIADELVDKHEAFAARLSAPEQVAHLPQEDWAWLTRAVTSTRRHARTLQEQIPLAVIREALPALLFETRAPAQRIADFVTAISIPDTRLAVELATGLLHYSQPQGNWLWTRWMWDTRNNTGILPLLAGSVRNLLADDIGQGYINVGSVTAMSMRFAEGTGLLSSELTQHPQRKVFAADAFLACAYCVYMYGITSWRLSREFHRLLPPLPKLARRLLGIRS